MHSCTVWSVLLNAKESYGAMVVAQYALTIWLKPEERQEQLLKCEVCGYYAHANCARDFMVEPATLVCERCHFWRMEAFLEKVKRLPMMKGVCISFEDLQQLSQIASKFQSCTASTYASIMADIALFVIRKQLENRQKGDTALELELKKSIFLATIQEAFAESAWHAYRVQWKELMQTIWDGRALNGGYEDSSYTLKRKLDHSLCIVQDCERFFYL